METINFTGLGQSIIDAIEERSKINCMIFNVDKTVKHCKYFHKSIILTETDEEQKQILIDKYNNDLSICLDQLRDIEYLINTYTSLQENFFRLKLTIEKLIKQNN